jgi:hypothetical protein
MIDTPLVETPRFVLDRVAFYGRTIAEYQHMFDLDLIALRGKALLDCPTGAASFVAEARKLGIRAVGCDPLYDCDLDELRTLGEHDICYVVNRIARASERFCWNFYRNIEETKRARTIALRGFLADFPRGEAEGRYVTASLPSLPFADRSFDVVLSGHLLFTHADILGYDFILSSLRELVRVSREEVKVMPLLPIGNDSSSPYERLDDLIDELRGDGIRSEILSVPFEFQAGSNRMLRLTRA